MTGAVRERKRGTRPIHARVGRAILGGPAKSGQCPARSMPWQPQPNEVHFAGESTGESPPCSCCSPSEPSRRTVEVLKVDLR